MSVVKRTLGAVMVTALLASSAVAADVTPLPAGKPAGAKEAALLSLPVFLLGLGILGAILAVSTGNNNNNVTTPTTTGTGV